MPNSAYDHRAWWDNPSSPKQHTYAQSWLKVGWLVDYVGQKSKWVRFRRSGENQNKSAAVQPSTTNSLNPGKGAQFQEIAAELFSDYFNVDLRLDYPIAIGEPPKNHKFDLVSSDSNFVGECKNYSWTEGSNVPSAKMGFVNEAVFYLSLLPKVKAKFIVMRKDINLRRNETLAEYYYRTYHHLLYEIKVFEIDPEKGKIKIIGKDLS